MFAVLLNARIYGNRVFYWAESRGTRGTDELPFIIGDTNTVNDAFSNLDTDIQVKKIKNVSEIGSESKSIFAVYNVNISS